jgi:hypothetical protein
VCVCVVCERAFPVERTRTGLFTTRRRYFRADFRRLGISDLACKSPFAFSALGQPAFGKARFDWCFRGKADSATASGAIFRSQDRTRHRRASEKRAEKRIIRQLAAKSLRVLLKHVRKTPGAASRVASLRLRGSRGRRRGAQNASRVGRASRRSEPRAGAETRDASAPPPSLVSGTGNPRTVGNAVVSKVPPKRTPVNIARAAAEPSERTRARDGGLDRGGGPGSPASDRRVRAVREGRRRAERGAEARGSRAGECVARGHHLERVG